MTTPREITVRTIVPASPAEAWDLYTTPGAVMRWNVASPDWCCPEAEIDLRVGGRHRARMEARDGSMGFDFAGSYEEVDAPHALTLRLDDGRRSRTTFEAEGTGTRVTTVFDAETAHPADAQRDGWQSILDSYRAHVEGAGRGG